MNVEAISIMVLSSAVVGLVASRMMGDIGLGTAGYIGIGIIGGLIVGFFGGVDFGHPIANYVINSSVGALILLQAANLMRGR